MQRYVTPALDRLAARAHQPITVTPLATGPSFLVRGPGSKWLCRDAEAARACVRALHLFLDSERTAA